jgi:HNH endonuclease
MSASRLQRIRSVMADRQRWLCYWCGKPMLPPHHSDVKRRCTADHIVPRKEGGHTSLANIVAAHGACNNKRSNPKTGKEIVVSGADDYTRSRIERVKSETRATDVHFDLLGFTLTIDGQTITLSHDAIRAMSHVISNLESETVDKLRREMKAERGPY